MTHFDIQKASLLDLLFEQRNKQYGAYVLRKYYTDRLSVALGITLTVAFSIFLIAGRLGGSDPMGSLTQEKTTILELKKIDFPKDVPKPLQPPKAKVVVPPALTLANTPPVIVPDPLVTKPVPTLAELRNAQISNVTVDVPGSGGAIDVAGPTSTGGGDGTIVKTPPAPAEPPFVANPSEAPQFPGGEAAWREYLAKMLNPPSDLEAGEKRSVVVRFLVAEDGAVTGFQVLRSGGAAFDSEVLRVLRRMPRWKPARQNGRAVATAFQQPVTFQAPDE